MAGGARGIQSIEISGRILKALVAAASPMMLKDLAQAADLAPAQCHAYLTSLRHVGLVHQESNSGLYSMGPFAMRLGIGWLRSAPLASTAIRATRALTQDMGIMSLIAVWCEHGPAIVHINTGIAPLALNLRQGTLYSVTGTATGRVFAAFDPRPEVAQQIAVNLGADGDSRALGSHMTRDGFEAQVATARRCGYATARGAPIPDINAVSVPVREPDGTFAMAISLIGRAAELSVEDGSPGVRALLDTAAAITRAVSIESGAQARAG
ncbi:MAG: helix-turn-helix domain-containing protein [Rhodobacter sp.]|nr:helix-turn-helix domain-containing protein [Paracoccaceae bacterium]MCC0072668.1 helix-turn-helix domain-containing protein [Rhodobacter sp.]